MRGVADGPQLRRAVARRDGSRARALRGTRRAPRAVPTAAGSRRRSTGDVFVLETTDGEYQVPCRRVRGRRDDAVDGTDPGLEHAAHYVDVKRADRVRRAERVHRRQAQLRLRDREQPAAVGEAHRARVTARDPDRRARPLAASHAVPPTPRRARARRLRHVDRRRVDRARRAHGRRLPRPRSRNLVGRSARLRLRRRDRGDGLPRAAPGSSPPRCRHGERREDPRADHVLGERVGSRHLLRRQRDARLARPAQAGPLVELGVGERLSLQRAHPRPPPGGEALRRRAAATARRAGPPRPASCSASSRPRPSSGSRRATSAGSSIAPTTACATTGSCPSRSSSTSPAPTPARSRSRWRRTGRSTRRSTCACGTSVSEHPLSPHPLNDYETEEHRRALSELVEPLLGST